MILVSACLLGQNVRYDGGHCLAPDLASQLAGQPYLALCPELLGGMGVPRPPADITGARPGREGEDVLDGLARVVTRQGQDVTARFLAGASQVFALAMQAGVNLCLLKDRSPSCAWDPLGQNPQKGPKQGVLAAMFKRQGVRINEVRAKSGGAPR